MLWIRFSLIEGKIGIVRMVHGDAVHCGRAGGDIEGFWCNPAKSQLQDTKANPLFKMGRGFHEMMTENENFQQYFPFFYFWFRYWCI